jgi:hypothetical protein
MTNRNSFSWNSGPQMVNQTVITVGIKNCLAGRQRHYDLALNVSGSQEDLTCKLVVFPKKEEDQDSGSATTCSRGAIGRSLGKSTRPLANDN